MAAKITKAQLKAEKAQRHAEIYYRALFEQTHDAVFIMDLKGNHLAVNQRAADMLGYKVHEILGLSVADTSAQQEQSREVVTRLMSGELIEPYERIFRKKDGSYIPVEINVELVKDVDGKPLHIQSVVHDITERKLSEEALKKSEERYRSIAEDMPAMICRFKADGTLTFINSFYCNYFNTPHEELIGSKLFSLIPKAEWKFVQKKYLSLDHKKPIITYEYKALDANGKDSWQRWTDRALFNEQGDVVEYQSIGEDITERKLAEQQLVESEARLRALVANTGDLIVVINKEGNITFASPSSERIFGYKPEEAMGKNFLGWIHPEDIPEVMAAFQSRKQIPGTAPQSLHVRGLHKDGSWRYVESLGTNLLDDPAIRGIILNIRDMTEQKRAELEKQALHEIMQGMALSKNLNEFLTLVHYSIGSVIRADNIFVTLYNPITGLFEDVYFVDQYDQPLHPSKREGTLAAYIFRTGLPLLVTDEKFDKLSAAKEVKLVGTESQSWLGVPLKILGKTIGVMAIQDYEISNLYSEKDMAFLASISGQVASAVEKKQAEERLRESEKRFANAFENAPIGMALVSTDGQMFKVNQALCDFLGYSEEELTALSFQNITHPDDLENDLQYSQQTVAGEIQTFQMEKRYQHKLGHYVWGALSVSLVRNDEGIPLYFISQIKDVTERKQAEDELRDTKNFVTSLLELAPLSIYVMSLDNTFQLLNRQWEEDSQIRREDALGHSMYEIFPAEVAQRYQAQNERVAESGALLAFEEWVEEINGPRCYYTHKFPLRDANGLVESIGGISLDVTERKQADKKLSESERRYRNLFENSPVPLWEEDFSRVKRYLDDLKKQGITDFHAYFNEHPEMGQTLNKMIDVLDVNQATLNMYHAKDKKSMIEITQVPSQGEINHYHEDFIAIAEGRTSNSWDGPDSTANGEPLEISLSWSVVPGYEDDYSKVIITTYDITERKLAKDKIIKSEQRYRSLFEDSPISLWEDDYSAVKLKLDELKRAGITDFETYFATHPEMAAECTSLIKILDANKFSVKLFNAKNKEELLAYTSRLLDTEVIGYHGLIHLASGLTHFEWEGVNQKLSGELMNIKLTWSVAPGYENDLSKVIISIIDTTERKLAEAEISRQLIELKTLYESGLAISRLLTPKEVAQKVIEVLGRNLNWHHIAIRQYQPETNSVELIGFNRPGVSMEEAEEFIVKMNQLITNPSQGLSGWVTMHGESLLVHNVKTDERYVDTFFEINSGLYVPLKIGRRVIGSISVESEKENAFTENDKRLLETLAGQAAIAIENANLFLMAQREILERKQAELLLQKDNQIMQLIASGARSFHATLEAITNNVEALSPANFCSILLLDEDGIHLRHAAAPSLPMEYNLAINGVAIGEGVGSCGTAAYRGETVIVSDIASDPLWVDYREVALKHGLRACWSTPIKNARGLVLGTFAIYHSEPYTPSETDFRLIESATQQAKIVIERQQAEAALQTQTEELLELNNKLEQRVKERTAEIEVTRKRLELATDAAELGIWEWDIETGDLIWDAQMYRIYGISPEDFDGKIDTQLSYILMEDQSILLGAAQAIMENKENNFKIEHRIFHGHGDIHTLFEQGVAVFDEHGLLERIIGIVNDVTLQKQAEQDLRESEAYARLLFDAAPDPVSVSEVDGIMVDVNRLFEQQHQIQREDARGRRISELNIFPPEQLTKSKDYIMSIVEGKEVPPVELDFHAPDGGLHTLEMHSYPINVKGRLLVLSTSRDITLHKKAEESLRIANAEMERALRVKDEFLANMSHELRTPLNAVLGMSESLEEQIAGPLNEKQLKYIRTISESGKHLLDLINDILDLSKIEAGRLELNVSQVSVSSLCEASMRMVKEQAQKKNLKTSLTIDPEVKIIMGDERRLKQSLVNLLSNAVKFTTDGHEIGVEVKGNNRNQTVTFTVWDEGIGITPEELKLIFKPFIQLDSGLAREFSGTGLGLALVSQMIRLHGGSVSVESKQGRGSRFSMTLPWVDVEGAASAKNMPQKTAAGAASVEKRNEKILIVEDTESIILLLTEYLQHRGYQILAARNGMEGVKLAAQERPDLILMDVMMPVMDGVEAAKQIRANKDLQSIPIIALTALAMAGDKERCLEAGMNDYLSKPVQMKDLESLILKHILKSKGLETPRA